MKRTLVALLALCVLFAGLVPAAAAGAGSPTPADGADAQCDDDRGPGDDGGPPGFVADLTPDFVGDLLGSLPVPGFLKSVFGAC